LNHCGLQYITGGQAATLPSELFAAVWRV